MGEEIMNELQVKKSGFVYRGKSFTIDDLFTEEFYCYSEVNVVMYKTDLCIGNEFFYTKLQNALAIKYFIETNHIDCIRMGKTDKSLYALITDVAHNCNVRVYDNKSNYNWVNKIVRKVQSIVYLLTSFVYLVWKMYTIPFVNEIDEGTAKFSLIRTSAAKKKMAFLNGVEIRYEQLTKEDSIYNCFSLKNRLVWVINSFFHSFKELRHYKVYVTNSLGKNTASESNVYYSKRVIHTLLYRYLINEYFKKHIGGEFYTGNCLDRFAIIEAEVAQVHNIKVICIPHGIEFGFLFPCGYPCDVHYTTTQKAEEVMNALYNTDKFIYNENITRNMFKVVSDKSDSRKVVFFTEPREVYVNIEIISNLLKLLENEGIELYLKLHPRDKKLHYMDFEKRITYIDDFNAAISNNICIARKSTVLVEALYNESISLAILINQKDKATVLTYPSLQDTNIRTFYSIHELVEFIKTIM